MTMAAYSPDNIYNMDKSVFAFNSPLTTTIASSPPKGHSKSKTWLTIAFAINATRTSNIPPFFIGTYARPRCFGQLYPWEHGFTYWFNCKAWMTQEIFAEYLDWLLRKVVPHNILLLVDNCSAHLVDIAPANIRLKFLPVGTTSLYQPLDAGIIAAFKKRFSYRKCAHTLNTMDHNNDTGKELNIYNVRFNLLCSN
jgi:hypothetical protein